MSGSGSLTLQGGGLIFSNSTGAGGTITGGTLQGSPAGELIVVTPQNATISSVIADNGGPTALTKTGSATLVLTLNNPYSGLTTIGAGTLQVSNSGALGTGGAVLDESSLVFSVSGASVYGGLISGAGTWPRSARATL